MVFVYFNEASSMSKPLNRKSDSIYSISDSLYFRNFIIINLYAKFFFECHANFYSIHAVCAEIVLNEGCLVY